jgi:plasmid stabilization system protein ParE
MAFKIRYYEDALADLEGIFDWSRDKHPETTEQFANELFDHIELLQSLPYIGTPIKGHPHVRRLLHSPLYVTTVWTRIGEQLKFCISGIAPEAIRHFSCDGKRLAAGRPSW